MTRLRSALFTSCGGARPLAAWPREQENAAVFPVGIVPLRRFVLGSLLVVAAIVLPACGGDDLPAETPTLTVEQLVARSADTPISVQGFLIDHDGKTRLCAAILESHPPQCGEPSVELVGLDVSELAGRQTDQGITWKESLVVTVQRRQDARFEVLSIHSG